MESKPMARRAVADRHFQIALGWLLPGFSLEPEGLKLRRKVVFVLFVLAWVASELVGREASEALEIGSGTVLPVGSIQDFAHMEEFFRHLPDTGIVDEDQLAKELPKDSLWAGDESLPGLATTPYPVRNAMFADFLYRQSGVALFDLHGAGYASASRDVEVELRPMGLVNSVIETRGLTGEPKLVLERSFTEALEALLAEDR